MVRLDFLVFGYRRISTQSSAERSKLLGAFMRSGIAAQSSGARDVLVRERDYLLNIEFISGQKCEISHSPQGLIPCIKRSLEAKLSLAAALASLLLFVLAPTVIWDVRVSGCERISPSYVTEALDSVGLSLGRPWHKIDRDSVELALLDGYPEISWISINRRGSVAYVELRESDPVPPEDEVMGYSNVVAASDCIIREISVTSGYAVVKVGQVVRRGDVLISGIPPTETGGAFCRAEGSVLGEVSDTLAVDVARNYTENNYGEGAKSGLRLKILNFSINIFKIYRNYGEKCVIIENNKNCRLFGKYPIPVSFVHEYSVPYFECEQSYSDADLVRRASEEMRDALLARASSGTLVRAKSRGGFTDTGYSMSTAVTVIEEVGASAPLVLE